MVRNQTSYLCTVWWIVRVAQAGNVNSASTLPLDIVHDACESIIEIPSPTREQFKRAAVLSRSKHDNTGAEVPYDTERYAGNHDTIWASAH